MDPWSPFTPEQQLAQAEADRKRRDDERLRAETSIAQAYDPTITALGPMLQSEAGRASLEQAGAAERAAIRSYLPSNPAVIPPGGIPPQILAEARRRGAAAMGPPEELPDTLARIQYGGLSPKGRVQPPGYGQSLQTIEEGTVPRLAYPQKISEAIAAEYLAGRRPFMEKYSEEQMRQQAETGRAGMKIKFDQRNEDLRLALGGLAASEKDIAAAQAERSRLMELRGKALPYQQTALDAAIKQQESIIAGAGSAPRQGLAALAPHLSGGAQAYLGGYLHAPATQAPPVPKSPIDMIMDEFAGSPRIVQQSVKAAIQGELTKPEHQSALAALQSGQGGWPPDLITKLSRVANAAASPQEAIHYGPFGQKRPDFWSEQAVPMMSAGGALAGTLGGWAAGGPQGAAVMGTVGADVGAGAALFLGGGRPEEGSQYLNPISQQEIDQLTLSELQVLSGVPGYAAMAQQALTERGQQGPPTPGAYGMAPPPQRTTIRKPR